jgi:hypothetical protein
LLVHCEALPFGGLLPQSFGFFQYLARVLAFPMVGNWRVIFDLEARVPQSPTMLGFRRGRT